MRRTVTLLAVVVIVVGLRPPVSAQSRFQQEVAYDVKPGQEMTWEGAIKECIAADTRSGGTTPIYTFQVVGGQTAAAYRVVLPFETWGERDGRAVAVRAFLALNAEDGRDQPLTIARTLGEEFTRVSRVLAESANETVSTVWRLVPEASANLGTIVRTRPARYYEVVMREVQRAAITEYQDRLADLNSAYEAAPSKLEVIWHVVSAGPSNRAVFRRAIPSDTLDELDGRDTLGLLRAHLGEDGARSLTEELEEQTVSQERYILMFREDLSRLPQASPASQ